MKEAKSCFTTIIEADSAEELKSKVLSLAASYGSAPQATSAPESTTAPSAPSSEGPKSGKKVKKETAPVESPVAAPAASAGTTAVAKDVDPFADDEDEDEVAPAQPKKLELEDIKVALQKVADTKGMDVARTIVGKFSEKGKISAVKEADYQKFVEACEKA